MTGVIALGIVAFWAAVAAIIWQALKPYRMVVVDLWELIPAGARPEVGLGLAIAGGVLLILFVIAGVVGKGEPAQYGGTARETYVGVDVDEADIDVSGM
ncbi:hypothetical protein [Actinoplanes sp. NPDC049118]|uniref:hypothetical protein n=1 Tax=Actinoplanes sp. NPDC049118 TaxID=3155769 RepID=UPI0033F8C13A